jgi:hypothetical protein
MERGKSKKRLTKNEEDKEGEFKMKRGRRHKHKKIIGTIRGAAAEC